MIIIYCTFFVLDYKNLLERYGMFLATHFANPRIVNMGMYTQLQ